MKGYYERFPNFALRPATLAKLEPMLRAAAEAEWEDEDVAGDLLDLANDFASRLERIEKGDLQSQDDYVFNPGVTTVSRKK